MSTLQPEAVCLTTAALQECRLAVAKQVTES